MKGSVTYHYRESINILLRTKWIGPYLLIPPLLAFIVYAETYLASNGFGSFSVLRDRTFLAIWNASFLLTLIAGIKSCMFFSGMWGSGWFRNSLALPVNRSSGYWGPFLAMLSVVASVYILTVGAVVAAVQVPDRLALFPIIAEAFLPVLWAVAMGAFLGVLTSGIAGSFFLTALLILGFGHGLRAGIRVSWLSYVIPPIGRLMDVGMVYPEGLVQVMVLMGHCTLFLIAGRILYGAGIRRR